MKVFDELLLDADWSVNAGTWMWLSCSSFFTQFFPLYDPVKFGRKADPNGDYIRKYVPVLKNYPVQYIHEPWMAPEQVQRAAKCIVGIDYPKPMIDHELAAKQNQERMRQVYQQLSTYRNIKTPEDPIILVTALDHKSGQGSQGQQSLTPVCSSAESTFVTSKYMNATLTTQQRKEQQQLMPAPMPVVTQQSQQPQSQPQHMTGQRSSGNPGSSGGDFTTGSVDDDQDALEVDSLMPSINNYQPQIVSETLQRDASDMLKDSHILLESRNSDLDVYQN